MSKIPQFGVPITPSEASLGLPFYPMYGVTPSNEYIPIQVDGAGSVAVTATFSGSITIGEIGTDDKTNFIYGTSLEQPIGGVYQDTAPTLTAGQTGVMRLTQYRGLHTNLRDALGNELLGQSLSASSLPVVIASDQSPIPVLATFPSSITVDQGTSPWVVSGAVSISNFPATQPISAVSLPLPTGAATATNQTTQQVALNAIETNTSNIPPLGQALATGSVPVVLTAAQLSTLTPLSIVAVTQSTSPWVVSGTVTTSPDVNVHDGAGNTIGSTGTSLNVDVTNTVPVTGTFFQATQPVSAASLPLPTGAATEATLSALNTKVTTTANGIKVDGSAVTQPISGTVASTQSGPWTVSLTNESIEIGTVDQGTPNTIANAWPVELSDGTNLLGTPANPIRVDPTGTTIQPVSGTITANQGTSPWVVSGTVTSNIGTTNGLALDATLTGGTQKTQIVDGSGNVVGPVQTISGTNYAPVVLASSGASGSAVPARTLQVGGSDGTNLRTLKVSSTGVLSVDGSATTQPVSNTLLSNLTGTWSYYSGVSGTVNVTTSQRVTGISAHSTAGGTMTINGGSTITIPANCAISISPNGNLVAPTIVFTTTDAYFIEAVL